MNDIKRRMGAQYYTNPVFLCFFSVVMQCVFAIYAETNIELT